MRYEFVRYIYENTGKKMCLKKWICEEADLKAQELEQKMNEFGLIQKLGFRDFKKKAVRYTDLRRALKDLCHYCLKDDGSFLEAGSAVVEAVYEKRKEVSTCEVIYIYFLAVELGMIESDACYAFFQGLVRAAGVSYNPALNATMEDVFFRYVLKTERSVDVLIKLLEEWETKQNSDSPYTHSLNLPSHYNLEEFTYQNLYDKTIEIGLDENARATIMSMKCIDSEMEALCEKAISVPDSEVSLRIFPAELIRHTLNVVERRQWYWYRILQMCLQIQIDNAVDAYSEYKKWKECHTRMLRQDNKKIAKAQNEKIKKFLRAAWLERRSTEGLTLSELGDHPAQIGSEENLEELLKNCVINVTKLYNYYIACFEITPTLPVFIGWVKGARTVTREFLMIAVLAAKALGVEYSMTYVRESILQNNRFDGNLKNTVFDNWFLKSFSLLDMTERSIRVITLKEQSNKLRKRYREKSEDGWDGTDIFIEILLGKAIE